MKGYIYEYYNHIQDMYYIGQTRNFRKRDWEHKKGRISNHSWFDNCYHKHPDQFTHRFLKIIEAPSKELLVKQLNELEIYYIAEYRKSGKKLYNYLSGGNAGWKEVPPTQNMLDALNQGRKKWNDFQHSQTSKEQQLLQHRKACKRYAQNNPEKYKQTYTRQNKERAAKKHEWYLKNRERILAKSHSKTQKALREAALNSEISLSLPK